MAIEMNNELFLDQEETAALIRNMIHPNLDAIRRRDAFLRDRDDMTFAFSEEGITAECSDIKIRERSVLRRWIERMLLNICPMAF